MKHLLALLLLAGSAFCQTQTSTQTQSAGGTGGGSGTVTSVTFTGDGIFQSATPSSAVTTSGTLTAVAINQAANCIFAGPSSGGSAAPSCRALVALDLPLAGVLPNPQTGTTYTYLTSDRVGYTSFSNASAIAVTLPQAGSAGFGTNWANVSCDIGAGTATITPTTSTISYTNGSTYTSANATLALTTGQCAWIYSDNTNYFAIVRGGGGAVSSVNTLTGAVVIENATAGQVAISGGGSAALTGAVDLTYATHTFSGTANTIFDLSAATGTAAFKVPQTTTNTASAAGAIDFDTTNKNFHGYVNGADSIFLNSAAALTTNIIPKAVIASGNMLAANSSITDNATTVTSTDTGGFVAPVFVSSGTTAGFLDLPQGTTSAAVAPCNAATSICIQAPTSVTSQLRVLASAPATGFSLFTNSSGTMTETISATSGTLTSGVGLLGTLALNAVLASTVANVAGHFTNLQVLTSLGGACSTLPQFNVFDGTSNTGSTVTASASTQTKGTGTSTAQTQTFAAGDVIGIYISTAGVTCTTDQFTVTAQYSIP